MSAELSDLLVQFASGLRQARVYGPKSTAVRDTATSFVADFSSRRGDHGSLAIATAGSHLIVEVRPTAVLARQLSGVITGVEHPLLGALADRLAAHEVGEIVLAEGVTAEEIASVMGFLSTDPARTGRALGREPQESLDRIPHIRVHGADCLVGAGGGALESAPARDPAEGDRLWTEFARAALGIPDQEESGPYPAAEIAVAIAARSGNAAFDRRIVYHANRLSSHLAGVEPSQTTDLRDRFSDVLRRLDRATVRSLLSMGGDRTLRRDFIRQAASSLPVDVVFELVRAAAEAEGSDISRWMLRLLSKLARHVNQGEEAAASIGRRSERALREQIKALLEGWDLENPNPADYEEALARMSASSGEGERTVATRTCVGHARVIQMSLETGAEGMALWRAVDRLVEGRRIEEAVRILREAPEGRLTEEVRARLAGRSVILRLVEEEDPDWDVLEELLPHSGLDAAGPLLDRLAASDSMSVRRRLFDLIPSLGPGVGGIAVRRLDQSAPWYVLRNLLSLLSRLEAWPDRFEPWTLTRHQNPQVRLEAVRLCLQMPATRERAIVVALADSHGRIVALGIAEAARGCPAEAEPRLIEIASAEEGEFAEFRPQAVRALVGLASQRGCDALLEIAAPRRRGLRHQLPPESPVLLAALRGLAGTWPADPRVREIVELARSTGTDAIREAVS